MKVKNIYIYPVKSMGGISVSKGWLTETGFQYDRQWMLVDEQGHFISQREIPELALFQPELEKDFIRINYRNESIEIGLDQYSEEKKVSVWKSHFKCKEVGPKESEWISDKIGRSVKVVVMDKPGRRKKRLYVPPYLTSVSFADGYPYLILGTASMDHLNNQLDTALDINRFRANIIVETKTPHEEDGWKEISVNEQSLKMIKPCARCVMTTINQETAEKGKEPLLTLSQYRKSKNKIMFGVNAISLTEGIVKVGDEVIPIDK